MEQSTNQRQPTPAEPGKSAFDLPEIMTVEQAANYLQLHKQVLYRHIRRGAVPVSRVGKTIRFKKSVLDQWLADAAWLSVGENAVEVTLDRANRHVTAREIVLAGVEINIAYRNVALRAGSPRQET